MQNTFQQSMGFNLISNDKDSRARAGVIQTDHGEIQTPIFMPVGTQGTVKGVHQHELKDDIMAQIILGNTYHLYLRPGMEIMEKAGGLHKFMSWDLPILTDSGGYQVYSLSSVRKITEEGVRFQSHIDGSYHFLSPESSIDIQRQIGADIIMAFDECTPYGCDYKYAKSSMELTHRWLKRCVDHFDNQEPLYGHNQVMFPIVQGSVHKDLRKQSAETIAGFNAFGNAIGGLSVGEPKEEMYAMTDIVCDILPKEKPRYLMGVGTPSNILECISLGVDMFDCVMPSRNARHGMLFTNEGTINIKNKKWATDYSPIDAKSDLNVDRAYSKAYLRHLFKTNEYLGMQIATIHNLHFYVSLTKEARKQIIAGTFHHWKTKLSPLLDQRI